MIRYRCRKCNKELALTSRSCSHCHYSPSNYVLWASLLTILGALTLLALMPAYLEWGFFALAFVPPLSLRLSLPGFIRAGAEAS